MDDLFASAAASSGGAGREEVRVGEPLASRMRPRSIDEVLGQEHITAENSPLRRLLEGRPGPSSAILWGPPGTGKTTLAYLASGAADRKFVQLSAVSAGVKDVRAVLQAAKQERNLYGRSTVLFLDEIHRFSKSQQDALLAGVEDGTIMLLAATTENPSFSVISPLLSRCLLVSLRALSIDDLLRLIDLALADERGFKGVVSIQPEAAQMLAQLAGGDGRRVLTLLESAVDLMPGEAQIVVTAEMISAAVDKAVLRYDREGDEHYDVASAFIKSMRGSDVDAALHYLARMLSAGEDPRFIARRIVISASEDIGLADPLALQTAVAAMQAVSHIGMPEARIILAQAVVHNALAPKSNAAYLAINAALEDISAGKSGGVPQHLRSGLPSQIVGMSAPYRYTHDEPDAISAQQFLPDSLLDAEYYHPTARGWEQKFGPRWQQMREVIRGNCPKDDNKMSE